MANFGTFLPPMEFASHDSATPSAARRNEPENSFPAVGPWPWGPHLQMMHSTEPAPVLPKLIDFLPGHTPARVALASKSMAVSKLQTACLALAKPTMSVSHPQVAGSTDTLTPATQTPTLKSKRKRIRIKSDRRREQCRANQERYRNKQRRREDQLKESVCSLRADIKILEMQRHCLLHGVRNRHAFAKLVAEYAELFRYGLQAWGTSRICASTPQEMLQASEAQQKLVFLRTTMAANVSIGGLQGIDAYVEQWERYSAYFGNLEMRLESMNEGPANVVVAAFTMHATITDATIRQVFPHLLSAPDSDEHSSIACRLVGKLLECQGSLVVHWDDESSRIARIAFTPDVLTPMIALLGSLEDALYVLEEARLTPEAHVGNLERHEYS